MRALISGVQPHDGARSAGQLNDVQSRVRAIHCINQAAIIDVDVIRLDRSLADPLALEARAKLDRIFGRLGYEIADLLRGERIADIDSTNSCIEVRDDEKRVVETRIERVMD